MGTGVVFLKHIFSVVYLVLPPPLQDFPHPLNKGDKVYFYGQGLGHLLSTIICAIITITVAAPMIAP